MSSNDIAVSVRGLSKAYTIAHNAEKHTTAAEALVHRLKNPFQRQEKETFWALKDVEFDIKKGDVVGIIGRNGAGKSTLLKILSRITEPTTGSIALYGRVGSLLEVGTGFHPELTGRENIFLNGAILGMSKSEIARQFDAIVDFAGVEQFIDTPVKRYSSGMYVRLAFAVASNLNSEILIVDEVLAVGDSEFQKKCLGKMQDVSKSGRTVIFVTHNMNSVSNLCKNILILKKGEVAFSGDVCEGLNYYMLIGAPQSINDLRTHPNRIAMRKAFIQTLEMNSASRTASASFKPGEIINFRFTIYTPDPIRSPRISVGFTNMRGERVFAIATHLSPTQPRTLNGSESILATFSLPNLIPGTYAVDIGLSDDSKTFLDEIYSAAFFEIEDTNLLQTTQPYFVEMGNVLVPSQWQVASKAGTEDIAKSMDLSVVGDTTYEQKLSIG